MIVAIFRPGGGKTTNATGLNQYDYGQVLRIQGLQLQTAAEIHFAKDEHNGESVTSFGITKDGITYVPIPDSLLATPGNIYAWVYVRDDNSGETQYKMMLTLKSRPKPEMYNPEDREMFEEVVAAVNEAADRADTAAGKSETAASRSETASSAAAGSAAAAELSATTASTETGEAKAAASEATSANKEAQKALQDTGKLAEQVKTDAEAVQSNKTEVERLAKQVSTDTQRVEELSKQTQTPSKYCREERSYRRKLRSGRSTSGLQEHMTHTTMAIR